jgi:L-lactate dehydrogenase complex protein LldG
MQVSKAKENILKKIREALVHTTPVPFVESEGNQSVFVQSEEDLALQFAQNFTSLQGKFIYCQNKTELTEQLEALVTKNNFKEIYCNEQPIANQVQAAIPNLQYTTNLATCHASITGCEALVARTGSIVLSTAQAGGRTASVYAPIHICVAYAQQLVYDIKDALQLLKDKYEGNMPSMISFATGPSRTADIEKTLVVGVHGPKEVYCFLVDEE